MQECQQCGKAYDPALGSGDFCIDCADAIREELSLQGRLRRLAIRVGNLGKKVGIDGSILIRLIRNQRVKTVFGFAVDQVVAIWGVTLSAPFLLSSLFNLIFLLGWSYPVRHYYPILTGNPFFPVQISIALILGYLLSDCLGRRSMLWVWVLPFLVLSYAVISVPTISPQLASTLLQAGVVQSRLSHYFGWGCRTQDRCLDQILVTMPFYTSAAFSIGALVARNVEQRRERESHTNFKPILSAGVVFLVAILVDLAISTRRGWQWTFPLIGGVPLLIGTYLVVLGMEMRRAGLANHIGDQAKS
jgi:uncharacterized membrane protein YgdD (TMEM256/DUF423 family)